MTRFAVGVWGQDVYVSVPVPLDTAWLDSVLRWVQSVSFLIE